MKSKYMKLFAMVVVDSLLLIWSFLLSICFGGMFRTVVLPFKIYLFFIISYIIINLVIYSFFKLYNCLWEIAGVNEYVLGLIGCVLGCFASIGMTALMKLNLIPNVLLAGFFNCTFILGARIIYKFYNRLISYFKGMKDKDFKCVLVIGAGYVGSTVIKEMHRHLDVNYKPVAIIDDDMTKLGTRVRGLEVVGGRNIIPETVRKFNIDLIVIAISNSSFEDRREIINICSKTGAKIKIVPTVCDLLDTNVGLKNLRDIDLKDLLGREPVKLDYKGIEGYLKGKVVLVTGGGGSIGSELCRQISRFRPRTLIIVDIYENNAYDIQNELKRKYPSLDLKVLIGSVRDKIRMGYIMNTYKPQVIFHAAAHKHVPLMEDSPMEAIKNNVMGTLNMAELADKYKVNKFILISTDKAVNPTNVMGASKRLCEMVIQSINKQSNTEYAAVRFGNVLGSNGSVVPLFQRQIKEGGPVTVTHREITRFFMLIPEAAQLVLEAATYAQGGEIFILDMGSPVKIYDLACELIRLSGYTPNKDIKIEITGLRPGEKLYEELLMAEEGLTHTKHNKIFIGKPSDIDFKALRANIYDLFELATKGDVAPMMVKFHEMVPTYIEAAEELVSAAGE